MSRRIAIAWAVALGVVAGAAGCGDDEEILHLPTPIDEPVTIDVKDVVDRDEIDGATWELLDAPPGTAPDLSPGTGDEEGTLVFTGYVTGEYLLECRFALGAAPASRLFVIDVRE